MSADPFIALDVDGVLADTYAYILRNLGLDPTILRTYKFADTYGEEMGQAIHDAFSDPHTWMTTPPLPGAREAVNLLHDSGVRFIFLSAFPAEFRDLREQWISTELGIDVWTHPLVVAAADAKPKVARILGVTHVVEDRPATANAVARKGINSILVPSSYAHEIPLDPRVRIVPLLDFAREITGKEAASGPLVCSIDGQCAPGAASPSLTH